MKKISIILALLITHSTLHSQDSLKTSSSNYRPFTINVDAMYNYQNCHGIELGFNIMTYDFNFNIFFKDYRQTMEFGAFLSCEYNFISPKNVFGPKFGIGMDHLLRKGFGYALKLNVVDYSPGDINDLRFNPHLGLTFLGIVNIYYGYNFSMSKAIIPEIGNHKITVNINFGYTRAICNAINAAGGI